MDTEVRARKHDLLMAYRYGLPMFAPPSKKVKPVLTRLFHRSSQHSHFVRESWGTAVTLDSHDVFRRLYSLQADPSSA